MKEIEYLMNHIFTEIKPSSTHGVGTFACRDINKGEMLFQKWMNESILFEINSTHFTLLPKYVQKLILRDIDNNLENDTVQIKLYKDSYFNLSNPHAFCNTLENEGNYNTYTSITTRDIKEGEEIFGTYILKN